MSNDTSYGKEAQHENTIDQILGNIEKSPSDSSYMYRKQTEEKIFAANGAPKMSPVEY